MALSHTSSRRSGGSDRVDDVEMGTPTSRQAPTTAPTTTEPMLPWHQHDQALAMLDRYATAVQPQTRYCIEHPFQAMILFLVVEVILFTASILVPWQLGTSAALGSLGQVGVFVAVGGLACCVCPVLWCLAPLTFLIPDGLMAVRKVQAIEDKTHQTLTFVHNFVYKVTHIEETFLGIGASVEDKFSTLGHDIESKAEIVGERLSHIGSELGGKFTEIGESVTGKFHDMAGKFEGVERMATSMHDKFDEIETSAVEKVKEGLTAFESGVKKDFGGVIDKIGDVENNLTKLLTKAKEKTKDVIDVVKNERHDILAHVGLAQEDYDGVSADGHKVLLIQEGDSHHFSHGAVSIRKAWFGAAAHDYEFTETHGADVTEKLKSAIEESDGTVVASVELFGDTAPRWNKVLAVEVRGVQVVIAKEGEVAELPNGGQVKRAWFGAAGHNWEWGDFRGKDVTDRVRQLAEVSSEVLASVENFGDPAPRWGKELLVEVRLYVPKVGQSFASVGSWHQEEARGDD